jgi:TRAP-type mannitol/chloroaromatic compound transport system permease small subunit
MQRWLSLANAIDKLNDAIGRAACWLVVVMILVATFNSVARYLGRFLGAQLGSNALLELQWYLFSLIFLLGAAYTLRHDGHVRVDLLYSRLSERGKAWLDLMGTIAILLPFSALMLWLSWPAVRNSWKIGEGSPDPGGLARYPIKSMILVAFFLLLLQGLALVIRKIAILRARIPDEPRDSIRPAGEGV